MAPPAAGLVVGEVGHGESWGPMTTYLAGEKLGGIVLVDQAAALAALAVGWAVMMPVLVWLSENLDGMPGKPRVWVARRSR